jgi:potassium-transporting ATPase KdpC subunit
MNDLRASLRFLALSLAVCAVAYPAAVWLFGQAAAPAKAEGSLIRDARGEVIGSELIAQGFTSPEYFWPRPSAVGYDAAAAGGSNLSPANPALAERARASLVALGASEARPAPPDLVTASGSGLDPHVTLAAARYQVARVAAARGVPPGEVGRLLDELACDPGAGLAEVRLVDVLELNLALDARFPLPRGGAASR